jgi:hypothetical protein
MGKTVDLSTYYYNKAEIDAFLEDKADSDDIPIPSNTKPSADTSSGNKGTSTEYARADHIHPKSSLYAQSSHNHTVLTQMTNIQGSFASTQQRSIFNRPQQGQWTFIDNKISYDGTNITYNSSEIATLDDIPTLLSDLTNDSDFIETSNTTGLIKNDGSIDTNNYVLTTDSRLSDERQPTQHSHELSDINSDNSYALSIWRDLYDAITLLNDKLIYFDDTGIVSYTNSDGDMEELANLHNIQDNIVDNLTTNDATKSLSAKQGKKLNDLIGNAITYINQ